jgi:hypothetical protein
MEIMVENRLASKGFTVKRDITIEAFPQRFNLIGMEKGKIRFASVKLDRIVFALVVPFADKNEIVHFSNQCLEYALSHFPRTLGAHNIPDGLLSVSAMISNDFSDDLKSWVSNTSPKKHFLAYEFPVLVSLNDRKINYFRKTPILGASHYGGFRKFAEETFQF